MPPPRGAEPPAAGEDGDDAAALAVLAEAEEAEEEAVAPEALDDFALFPLRTTLRVRASASAWCARSCLS